MPTPRKLHTALAELEGRQAAVSPTVAAELARTGHEPALIDGISPAEHALKTKHDELPPKERQRFERDAWWAQMWRDPESPYRLVALTTEESLLADDIAAAFDRSCFTAPIGAPLAEHHDAQIVAEALATNAKLLLTSNMRSIRQTEVNDWAERWGDKLGFVPQRVVNDADATLVGWARDPKREDRLLQAALMACWPDDDSATAGQIIHTTALVLNAMGADGGGRLPATATKLAARLRTHPDREDLLNRTRMNLPSLTIETDRDHPSHPRHPVGPWQGARRAAPGTKNWQRQGNDNRGDR